MTFRGTVQAGLIVIDTHGKIPDGTEVEVIESPTGAVRTRSARSTSSKRPAGRAKPKAKPRKSSANKKKGQASLEAFRKIVGIWADRPEWKGKTSVEIARELREKSMRRPRG